MSPQNSRPLETQVVIVLGNRVSADGIKLRSCGTGVGPESSDWCPYEKTETQTQRGERHGGQALGGCCDDGGGVMSTQTKERQGHRQSLGERRGSLGPAEGTNPADALIFDFDAEDHGSRLQATRE